MMDAALVSQAVIAGNAEVFTAIRDDEVALAIWERPVPDILSIPLNAISNMRFQCGVGELPDMLQQAMNTAGFGKRIGSHVLLTDILMLANHFARAMCTETVEIRLERIVNNACKKFHADYVTARLITTYVGQGTQWLDGPDAADCDCGDLHNIRQLDTGDIGIFKGRLWPESAPAIHRSPPIEGSGEERLVLVINPAG